MFYFPSGNLISHYTVLQYSIFKLFKIFLITLLWTIFYSVGLSRKEQFTLSKLKRIIFFFGTWIHLPWRIGHWILFIWANTMRCSTLNFRHNLVYFSHVKDNIIGTIIYIYSAQFCFEGLFEAYNKKHCFLQLAWLYFIQGTSNSSSYLNHQAIPTSITWTFHVIHY